MTHTITDDEKARVSDEIFERLNAVLTMLAVKGDMPKAEADCAYDELDSIIGALRPTQPQPAQGVDLDELSLNLAYKPATHVHALLVKHFTTPPTTGEQETE